MMKNHKQITQVLIALALLIASTACSTANKPTVHPGQLASTSTVIPSPSSTPAPVATSTASTLSPTLVLINGTLIDGAGAAPIPDAALVIQAGQVAAAGPRSAIAIPAQAEIIDVQGGTILPGFINAHVHSAYNLGNLEAWAKAGVTTVRDLGGPVPTMFSVREQAGGEAKYARLVTAGEFITPPGGYPIAVFHSQAITVSTPDQARQAVNDLLDQGADIIKIGLESGQIFGETLPMLSPETVAAIVEVAHQRGTLVVAHVTVSKDLKLAIDYGVDDVAHMVTDRLPDELISRMVAADIYWEPTLELWKNVGQGQDQWVIDNLRRYVAAGGKVALGTDYDGYSTPFQLGMPVKEIEWMQEAGMSPMQIIVAGTRHAAHVCNLQNLGTLEAGKLADVLVVQGNPLQDIHALSNVVWVIHNGVVIQPANP